MKILLTGSAGNLGRALMRQGSDHAWTGVERGDWGGIDAKIAECDVAIHAASDLLTPVWRDPARVMDANVGTTVRLLEALKKSPRTRLILISSCAVYGRSQVTHEESDLAPITINGTTKLLNEQLVSEVCAQTKTDYLIARLFNTYGGDDRFSILSHIRRAIESRRPFTVFNGGRSQRDFIHVDDVARSLLRLMETPRPHRIYNIGSGEAVKIRDVIAAFQARHPGLEVQHRERSEAEYSRADVSRLIEALGPLKFRQVLADIAAGEA